MTWVFAHVRSNDSPTWKVDCKVDPRGVPYEPISPCLYGRVGHTSIYKHVTGDHVFPGSSATIKGVWHIERGTLSFWNK